MHRERAAGKLNKGITSRFDRLRVKVMEKGRNGLLMRRQTDQPETRAATQDEFDWVNAWAAQGVDAPADNSVVPRESNVVSLRLVPETPEVENPASEKPGSASEMPAASVGPLKNAREHQVVLDILAIMRARDSLGEAPPPQPPDRGWGAIFVKAHRTADSVPVILGSVMGLLMVIVFSTAAAFVKLAR